MIFGSLPTVAQKHKMVIDGVMTATADVRGRLYVSSSQSPSQPCRGRRSLTGFNTSSWRSRSTLV